jgi:hypothetical protein
VKCPARFGWLTLRRQDARPTDLANTPRVAEASYRTRRVTLGRAPCSPRPPVRNPRFQPGRTLWFRPWGDDAERLGDFAVVIGAATAALLGLLFRVVRGE